MKTEKSNTFQQQQFELAQQIRTGLVGSADRRRVKIYQELFFNNIEGFCANAYPVLKSVLPEPVWRAWIRAFLIHSKCESPFFKDIAEEFLSFLNDKLAPVLSSSDNGLQGWEEVLGNVGELPQQTQSLLLAVNLSEYPWLLELAHYEWVELFVSTQEPEAPYSPTNLTEFKNDEVKVRLSASALPLAYQYPVQTIRVGNVENIESQLTPLLVFQSWGYKSDDDSAPYEKDKQISQGETQFVMIDLVSVHLLHFLQSQTANYSDMLAFLQSPTLGLSYEQATAFLDKALMDFCQRGVLISA